jgi:thiol-disulfide isomerase/thioredoxin
MRIERRDIILLAVLSLGFGAYLLYGGAPAARPAPADAGRVEVIAATFNAAWCSACKIVKPRLKSALREFAQAPVRFVEYDLTFGPDGPARAMAEADGLQSVYERFSKATGYTLLIDADDGSIIDMLTVRHDAAAMRAALNRAIEKAQGFPRS